MGSGIGDDTLCPGLGGTGPRCPESICDCFVATHPENPTKLRPEAFTITFPPKPDDGDGPDIDYTACPF